jgi:hypothetical protein
LQREIKTRQQPVQAFPTRPVEQAVLPVSWHQQT